MGLPFPDFSDGHPRPRRRPQTSDLRAAIGSSHVRTRARVARCELRVSDSDIARSVRAHRDRTVPVPLWSIGARASSRPDRRSAPTICHRGYSAPNASPPVEIRVSGPPNRERTPVKRDSVLLPEIQYVDLPASRALARVKLGLAGNRLVRFLFLFLFLLHRRVRGGWRPGVRPHHREPVVIMIMIMPAIRLSAKASWTTAPASAGLGSCGSGAATPDPDAGTTRATSDPTPIAVVVALFYHIHIHILILDSIWVPCIARPFISSACFGTAYSLLPTPYLTLASSTSAPFSFISGIHCPHPRSPACPGNLSMARGMLLWRARPDTHSVPCKPSRPLSC